MSNLINIFLKKFHKSTYSFFLATHVFMTTATMTSNISTHNYYNAQPLKWGIEITGINLETDPPNEVQEQIKKDVLKHKIVVFRNQGIIGGPRQVEISRWFGEPESTFYKHPRSPHPDVFRVSNDANEGCTGVGRTGWHIDGSFQPAPFAYSIYHIISVPKEGATVFAPLNELIRKLPKKKSERWERLWMVSDRRTSRVHPLIYSHPVTHEKTLCFHLGMTDAYMWDYGTKEQRITSDDESQDIHEEIHEELVKDNNAIQYEHKWQEGDFIISDNLAVAHEAHPSTQYPCSQVGLRVMHRVTIQGTIPPAKLYESRRQSHDPKQNKEEL